MRKILMAVMLVGLLAAPVHAMELNPPDVPESAVKFMPSGQDSLGTALLEVIRDALMYLNPNLKEACCVCVGIVGVVMIVSMAKTFPGASQQAANILGTVAISTMLLQSANSMINLAVDTVAQISDYGKLLLPVMTTAMASQGGITASAALYAGTAMFDTLLSNVIAGILTPMIYFFLALAVGFGAVGEEMLLKLKDMLKSIISWTLKTILYIFTGYISITGVVSGTTDAAAQKMAKLTISGAVPVVGGILSDASEAVLVAAGTVKNTIGVYGLFAVLAIWLEPFIKISAHYLMLKFSGMICGIFGSKQHSVLIQDFSAAMGLLLAMTGSVCLMLMISMVCFLKGAA